MIKRFFLLLFALYCGEPSFSQYNPSIDVLHYEFHIGLNDRNDTVNGRALVTLRFTEKAKMLWVDLANINDTGRGMTVQYVRRAGRNLSFVHRNNILQVTLPRAAKGGDKETFEIVYAGVPADGLIFSRNKFGNRTIFADHWPNRAHNWLPCKDHISDKAAVDFIVTAPSHYQVISNGVKIEDRLTGADQRLTHWKEDVPLPMKVAVIGLADFAVDRVGDTMGIPLSSWVFPEQKEKGFYDYAQAKDILPWYITHIGPFSYLKLANVQSKTIFGGMENAGAIFYSENSVTGTRRSEDLLAHEIAHQWFGDAVTETDWPHLWLSEGFATEMTNLYLESKYGRDTLVKRLSADRKQVLAFVLKKKLPVIDTTESGHLMALLNQNSYQKGGWVLHMLRMQLGDGIFWKGIRTWYADYRGKNASTTDFRNVMEQVSGKDLHGFFDQWLYTPENPTLEINWSYNEQAKEVFVTLTQKSERAFSFPLELELSGGAINHMVQLVDVNKKQHTYNIPVTGKPAKVSADPDCKLLFSAVIKEN